MRDASFTLELFTPAEAEQITGLSRDMQRDYRRRGIMPPIEGHARYDVFDLCDMRALKAMSDAGLNPKERLWMAAKIGLEMLGGVAIQAWIEELDLEGWNHNSFKECALPILKAGEGASSKEDWKSAQEFLKLEGLISNCAYSLRSTWERRQNPNPNIEKGQSRVMAGGNLAMAFPDGETFYGSWKDAEEHYGAEFRDKCDGALIVFDLHSLGRGIVQRALRPLWVSHADDMPDGGTGE